MPRGSMSWWLGFFVLDAATSLPLVFGIRELPQTIAGPLARAVPATEAVPHRSVPDGGLIHVLICIADHF